MSLLNNQGLDILVDEVRKDINKKVNAIGDNLIAPKDNTKYTTVNGYKEFDTTSDGYVDKICIEGKTYINLANPNNIFYTDGVRYNNPFKYIELGKTYTIINLSDKAISYTYGGIVDVIFIEAHSRKIYTSTITDSNAVLCYGHSQYGWVESDAEKDNLSKSIIVLEGEHLDVQLPYFTGVHSVGHGNKIEITTCCENLFKKSDFIVGSTNSVEGEKFTHVTTTYNNRITHTNPIPVNMFEYIVLRYANNASAVVYELDENDIILKRYMWSKYEYVRAVTPNTKYVRIIFAYDDNRAMTINDFDTIMPILSRKHDKQYVNTTCRSLSDTIKDYIYNINGKYYKIQKCSKVILNGTEKWGASGSNADSFTYYVFYANQMFDVVGKVRGVQISDKFSYTTEIVGANNNGECFAYTETSGQAKREFRIAINKNKLATKDAAGFTKWVEENNITVIYELEHPIITELANFNPKTFNGTNIIKINSGVAQCEANFEVTNSLRTELDVVKDIIQKKSQTIHYSTVAPTNDQGEDGDIWVIYSEEVK